MSETPGDAGDPLDDWAPLLDDLAQRKGAARGMGGAEKVERRRATGRLDARARIDHLLDSGSFTEIGTLVGEVPEVHRHAVMPVARNPVGRSG